MSVSMHKKSDGSSQPTDKKKISLLTIVAVIWLHVYSYTEVRRQTMTIKDAWGAYERVRTTKTPWIRNALLANLARRIHQQKSQFQGKERRRWITLHRIVLHSIHE